MRRLFTGLSIPRDVSDTLHLMQGGIEGARWTAPADFHVTLTFLGEVPDDRLEDLDLALAAVRAAPFDFELAGTGAFAQGKWPNVLWLGVLPCAALADLKHQVDQRLRLNGIAFETRKYSPHVTVARLRHAGNAQIAEFMQLHNLYRSRKITAENFILYESGGGADQRYLPLEEYPLGF